MGFRKFIACGGYGVLENDAIVGTIFVVTAAVRDEGVSYHYLPPGREVPAHQDTLAAMVNCLDQIRIPYCLGKTQHSGMIWGVFVKPAWRGAGIAQYLVEACIEWGKNHAVTVVKLGVAATNIPAIRCYARCGFAIYGIEPQAKIYESAMVDEILMARDVQN